MSEQYRCNKCGYILKMKDMMCSECGTGYFEHLRWTKGGDGSHWDCRIAQLEKEIERLAERLHDEIGQTELANDAANRWRDTALQLSTYCGEARAELARRDEELALTEKKLCNIDRSARAEVARRDEIIKQQGEVSVIFQEQLSRREEIIRRLKEVGGWMYIAHDEKDIRECEDWCALMKELEND